MARNRPLAFFTPFQPLQAFTHLRGETTTPLWCFSLRPSATPAPGTGSSSRGPRAQPTCSGGGHSGSDPGKTLRNFIPICPISTGPFRESSNSWRERPSRSRRPAKAYELRCPSEFEAQIWDHASKYAVSVDFGALRCPVKIVSSDPTSQNPDAPTFDFGDADVDHEFVPETTHFLQLEKPQECAVVLRRFLKEVGILESRLFP